MSDALIDSNPQLLKVRAEIEAILDREKIGGAFQIANSTHTEFALRFPDWCAIQPESGPNGEIGFRVKSSSAGDGTGHLESSLHMLFTMRDCLMSQAMFLAKVSAAINQRLTEEGVEIEHKPFGGDDQPTEADKQ